MILVDDREFNEHPEILEVLGIPDVQVARMDAADYSFLDKGSEPVGIERSEIGNFVQKLRSGELESQMYKCQEAYSHVILLIEGVYDEIGGLLATYKEGNRGYFRVRVFPNTYYSYVKAAEVRLSEMGIEVIYSPNFSCSMDIIRIIYEQRTKPEEEHSLFKRVRTIKLPVKLSSNPSVPKLMALANHMPEKVAIRLIHKYDTIWAVLNAQDNELLEVEGMGKGLLKSLKEGIGKN